MQLKKILMSVGLTALMISNAFAADWYVSLSNGKNKNAGNSPSAPFKNLWKAIESAAPGDTIKIAEGNYPGKTSQGWILLDKPLKLYGGYSPDFSSRDPIKYQTALRPTNEQNATKPMEGMGTLALKISEKLPESTETVIDGMIFDQGAASSFHD